MSDPEPLKFERVGVSNALETKVAGSIGWSGYLLPSSVQAPESIGLEQSLSQYNGHYLFSTKRPSLLETDPEAFCQQVLDHIQSGTNNRVVFWLENADPLVLGDIDNYAMPFFFVNSIYQTTDDMNLRFGTNASYYALTGTRLSVDESTSSLQLLAFSSSIPPTFGFRSLRGDPLGVSVTPAGTAIRAFVPFAGSNTGCVTFDGTLDTLQAFTTQQIGQGFRFVLGDTSASQDAGEYTEPKSIFYDAFDLSELPRTLPLAVSFDPGDPCNRKIGTTLLEEGNLRSGFALKSSPSLVSTYRTSAGQPVSLVAAGSASSDIVPAPGAGGFSFAASAAKADPVGSEPVFFEPTGAFGLAVETAAAGSPDKLICGLFGSETLNFHTYDSGKTETENDLLVLVASQAGYAPIFPFQASSLEKPASGAVRARLTDDYLAAWSTVRAGGSTVAYSAEPQGSGLFGKGDTVNEAEPDDVSVLDSTPPGMALPQGNAKLFPMVPYGAATRATVSPADVVQFESQIIAAERKTTISKLATETWAARAQVRNLLLKGAGPDPEYATTPQGFIVEYEKATGAYMNVGMAQSLNLRADMPKCGSPPPVVPQYLPFSLAHPTQEMQDALQTNQLFMVAVNPEPFQGGDPATGACFENTVNIADWTMSAEIGNGATATSYKNVLIMKFCSGSLLDRVNNPNRWTSAEDFSLLTGDAAAPPEIAYLGLSQWLQDYFKKGIAKAEGRSAAFYQNFKEIATNPDWNGVIVLAADLSAENLPPEIAGLAGGIDFTRFAAHHFGFTVSRVSVDKPTGKINMEDGPSSLFGLIDYEDPRYAANLDTGVSPETPIPVMTNGDFDFTVLQLQSLFENAKLAKFQSRIQLTVDSLFGSTTAALYNGGVPQPANGVVLDGSYIKQGTRSTYVFEQNNTNVLVNASNVLPAVAFNRVQFNTLGALDQGRTIASRFLIWGQFDFNQLEGKDDVLDVLSFGSPQDTKPAQLGEGLAFSNLSVNMSFPAATPNAIRFALNTDNLAWDVNASAPRPESLFSGFALQLKSFVNAAGGQTPTDLGFLPVTSDLSLTTLEDPWFGVVYEITLGGPGALASGVGFSSQLLVAWSPSSQQGDQHAVFLGMSLPGAAPGASLFSLQGVFKVAVGSISILRQPVPTAPGRVAARDEPASFYCLRIDDIAIKIFGIVKLPPSANIQFFLFGDPNNTGSLGWYAAYVADDNPGCDQSLAFAEVTSDTRKELR